MLEIAEVCIDFRVLVGQIVPVEIADDGEVGRVADPQVAAVPRESLDGIQSCSERLGRIGDAVTIRIGQHHDGIAGRIRLGIAVLRPLPDEEAAAGVECHGTRVPHHGLEREEFHLQFTRYRRQREVRGGLAENDGGCEGCRQRQRREAREHRVCFGVLHPGPHRRSGAGVP
jgi:hypothetical protein